VFALKFGEAQESGFSVDVEGEDAGRETGGDADIVREALAVPSAQRRRIGGRF
jgi:hypothetical protein